MYTCNIRLILEYAVQVWQDTPAYLSYTIESIQGRRLSTIPRSSKLDIVSRLQDIYVKFDGSYEE